MMCTEWRQRRRRRWRRRRRRGRRRRRRRRLTTEWCAWRRLAREARAAREALAERAVRAERRSSRRSPRAQRRRRQRRRTCARVRTASAASTCGAPGATWRRTNCSSARSGSRNHPRPFDCCIHGFYSHSSGGLSNLLFEVALPPELWPPTAPDASTFREAPPPRVLLRLYGQLPPCGVDCARDGLVTEAVVFTLLSETQRGPRLLGVFPGGRLEEYIPARPLLTKELSNPILSCLIAEKIAQIHMMNVPINKEPYWLWETMERWLETINISMNNERTLPEFQDMWKKIPEYDLKGELSWMKSFLVDVDSPVVFCHNDLQEGNILLRNTKEVGEDSSDSIPSISDEVKSDKVQLVVIDFEYCAYNYRGFDFANHMCEWTLDYTNEHHPYFWARPEDYPTKEQQTQFFQCYLKTFQTEQQDINEGAVDEKTEIDKMLWETQAFTLATHFFWGLWSVVNATVSKITFDYWAYGENRFKAYFKHKSQLVNKISTADDNIRLLCDKRESRLNKDS